MPSLELSVLIFCPTFARSPRLHYFTLLFFFFWLAMGQFHSSQTSSVPEQDKKTDYYELLGVARDASDDE